MKLATCLMHFLLSVATIAGGCKDGNQEVKPMYCYPDCPEEEILCCVPVGDGSAMSCTDGEDWWCLGNCAAEEM